MPVVIIGLIAGNLFLLAIQIPSFFSGINIHKYKDKFDNSYIRYTILALSLILFCVELFVIIPNIETSGRLSLQTMPAITNYLNRLILSSSAVVFLLCWFGKEPSKHNYGGQILAYPGKFTLGIYVVQSLLVERLCVPVIVRCNYTQCLLITMLLFLLSLLICAALNNNKTKLIIGL